VKPSVDESSKRTRDEYSLPMKFIFSVMDEVLTLVDLLSSDKDLRDIWIPECGVDFIFLETNLVLNLEGLVVRVPPKRA
jgi:hypothetical protein